MMRALVLGAASLAISAGAASAQTVYPSGTAPLYDYAGPASSASAPTTPLGYGPLIYAPQLFAPTPAFPTPLRPAITQRSQWWFRSRHMTTHPVIGRQRQNPQHLSRLELLAITAIECTW